MEATEAIAYVRCSTQEQADSGLGLHAQEDRIRAYCGLKDLRLREVIRDAGVSGGKPLASMRYFWQRRLRPMERSRR